MQLIDTHCHLCHARLGRIDDVLTRGREAGLAGFICATGDIAESQRAAAIAATNDDVWCLAGIHPHEAKDAPEDSVDSLAALAAGDRCVAIGEIGLDYHYDFSPRPRQREVFAAQLGLAKRLGMPVVIHTREAFDDTLALLDESGVDLAGVIFHSFSEGPDAARAAMDRGCTISFSGIVTFASAADVQAAAKLVPDDRLLIETDAPYLSPEPVRKIKPNEPAYVAHVAAFLASLRGTTADALADLTTANARRVFGLDHRG